MKSRDAEAVIALWTACELTRPWNDPASDIARKVGLGDDLFLVGEINGVVVASVMAGYEGHRGWINYLAVEPSHRNCGFARQLMTEAERRLHGRGCPKVNLQVRTTNLAAIGFYERIGYTADEVVSMGRRLIDDDRRPHDREPHPAFWTSVPPRRPRLGRTYMAKALETLPFTSASALRRGSRPTTTRHPGSG